MKKVLAIVMAVILTALCFTGCSGKNKKLVILDEPLTQEPYAFALKMGNYSLLQRINNELNALISEGKVKEIFEKYEEPYTAPEVPTAPSEITTGDDSLQKVLDAGKLVIATSPDFPPFESLENGKVIGIEIEIMELICQKLGVELQIEQMKFDSILAGISAGKYDLGVSGFTATAERKKECLFTDAYYITSISLVVPEGSSIKSAGDVKDKTVSCQSGTTAELYCQDNNIECKAFANNPDAQIALTSGKVDAWAIDALTAADMVADYNKGVE